MSFHELTWQELADALPEGTPEAAVETDDPLMPGERVGGFDGSRPRRVPTEAATMSRPRLLDLFSGGFGVL